MTMAIRSLANDLKMGMSNEETVLDVIKKQWPNENNIKNTKEIYNNEYHPYDFESESGTTWELKSRRNSKWAYNTTIIKCHKMRHEQTADQYFIFKFTNRICYIKYERELFDTFQTSMRYAPRQGKNEIPELHIDIPVELLIDIE
jgi:hypothetical protein